MVDRCMICGDPIPEGRQVCPICEDRIKEGNQDDQRVVDPAGSVGRRNLWRSVCRALRSRKERSGQ